MQCGAVATKVWYRAARLGTTKDLMVPDKTDPVIGCSINTDINSDRQVLMVPDKTD